MTEGAKPTLRPAWRAWLYENLARGVSRQALIDTLVRREVPIEVITQELCDSERDPYFQVIRNWVQAKQKLDSLLDIYRRMARHRRDDEVATFAQLPADELHENFRYRNRPVKLIRSIGGSPALKKWTPEFFGREYGNVDVPVTTNRGPDLLYEFDAPAYTRTMSFREFVDKLLASGPTNEFYITGRNEVFALPALRGLRDDIVLPEGYFDPARETPFTSKLWFGPSGTVTPFHHDTVDVLLVQIYGSKQVNLVPSWDTPLMHNHRGVFSETDAALPGVGGLSRDRAASQATVLLNPGECLLIPVGWWHEVRSLSVSISLGIHNFGGLDTSWRGRYWMDQAPPRCD